jgi:hypothetical protein
MGSFCLLLLGFATLTPTYAGSSAQKPSWQDSDRKVCIKELKQREWPNLTDEQVQAVNEWMNSGTRAIHAKCISFEDEMDRILSEH